MNQLAGVLSDLGLVRWPHRRDGPKKGELDELKDDEMHASTTDLAEIRKKWAEDNKLDPPSLEHQQEALRNHGLFSKAERALKFADWSPKAREDVEIFTWSRPKA